jgi:ATP-dependent exoDNAse (exonuclease V) beta subunit
LLFNFFADSEAEIAEWVAILDDAENPEWSCANLPPPCTDVAELMALNEDLKHLYVALTRARRRVIIFDNGTKSKRTPFFELLEGKDLAVSATVEDLALSSAEDNWMDAATQSHQWAARGDEMMQVGTLGAFEEAAKCYRRGGHQPGELRAMAQIFQLQVTVSNPLSLCTPLCAHR